MHAPVIPLHHTPYPRRTLLFFGVALVWHLLGLYQLSGMTQPPSAALRQARTDQTVAVTLRSNTSTPATPPTTSAQNTPPPANTGKTNIAVKHPVAAIDPVASLRHISSDILSEQTAEANSVTTSAQAALAEMPAINIETTNATTAATAATTPTPTPDTSSTTDISTLTIAPPRSGHIRMQLIRTEPHRNPVYGIGNIEWEVNHAQYRMRVEAALDLLLTTINLYQLQSTGTIDRFGITPHTSTETRRSRSSTATHFDHQTNTVSFSSSNKSLALVDGAQDKATVLMQLAGIGVASPAQFQAGRTLTVQVAEERDATTFQFIISGQEDIATKLGTLTTWHLVRPPRPGSYSSTLDVWLAPEHAWYPVQIRNTESNGAVTTQTATQITYSAPER